MEAYLDKSCPKCGHELHVRVAYAGHRVRCTYCGGVFEMPTIPGYELLGTLGDGSMGHVYKARQTSLGRLVALKVLRESLARDPEYVRRFRLEAEVAARLSHDNIVHVFDAGEADGRPYLVLEYAEGETALVRLHRVGRFDERAAAEIGLGVAEALAHAQGRGLVHRDIKPANVILGASGGVKLLDLGLARPVADAAWASAEEGNAIGTPEYISPEQVRGRVDVDIRSDIYALGATLYHLVTGRVPFSGTTVEVLRQHADPSAHPAPPRTLAPEIGAGFEAVIMTMLAKRRGDRYATPEELIVDLRHVLLGEPPLALGREPPGTTPDD